MQSLSDLPNVQLKSDIIQMMFNQMPIEETIPFSEINGYWQNEWNIHLGSRKIDYISLQPHWKMLSENVYEKNPTCGVFVSERGDVLQLLFAEKARSDRGSCDELSSLLRHFFRLIYTCKSVRDIYLNTHSIQDRPVDEKLIVSAIQKEFCHFNPDDFKKVNLDYFFLTTELLFCLKWFNCQVLALVDANAKDSKDLQLIRGVPKLVVKRGAFGLIGHSLFDTMDCQNFTAQWPRIVGADHVLYGHIARLITEWQLNLRDIEYFKFEMAQAMTEIEINAMVDEVFRLLGTGCKTLNPRHEKGYFQAGISAKRDDAISKQNDTIEKLGVIWDQEEKEGIPLNIIAYRRMKKRDIQ